MHFLFIRATLLVLISTPQLLVAELNPQGRLQEFLSLLKHSKEKNEPVNYYELGLNSDDSLIYLHCLEWAVDTQKLESLVILEQRVLDPSLVDEAKRQTHVAIIKLRFYHTRVELKPEFLRETIKKEDPDRHPDLFEWLLDMLCEWGEETDIVLLKDLEKLPSLKQTLIFTKKRLMIGQTLRNTLQAYIDLYRSDFRHTRHWALQKLSGLDDTRAGEFLTHLYQEANLSYSRMEFNAIESAYLNHKRRFPNHHGR